MSEISNATGRTIATLTERLLACRNGAGHWEGRLASSALSTATATIALKLAEAATDRRLDALIKTGTDWLAAHQNADGGWGDTVLSSSNLSTTALCWSALSLNGDPDDEGGAALRRAEPWLRAQVGELDPDRLRDAILRRYGKDRTFSAPILTVLALAGRLGTGTEAWRLVPQLPFELAACPHAWFRWLRLPVVSYAVPALVAIGQARHEHRPTRNPILRAMRSALRLRTLTRVRAMQPASGGYLEATPLTAFVAMSLISAGRAGHPVVQHALDFLVASARADGSWPIDTNLATWVTTLSANALAVDNSLVDEDRQRIVAWLLGQQLQAEHPFTHARPGGWAWTDLSGGVPDADDTAGALLALWNFAAGDLNARASAGHGIAWLLEVQNSDGGIPTFCRGWGALPFDRSAPDLTAHALEAWSAWRDLVPIDLQRRLTRAAARAITYLAGCQRADGSWSPLWFGNESVAGETNLTYGTSRAVAALASEIAHGSREADRCRARGLGWLLTVQNDDGGWGGGDGAPSSLEETGVALQALGSCAASAASRETVAATSRGVRWIVETTDEGRRTPASPIGLYFARLWYFEEMYPLVFALRGLLEARNVLGARPGVGAVPGSETVDLQASIRELT